jgi:hypothetical protein
MKRFNFRNFLTINTLSISNQIHLIGQKENTLNNERVQNSRIRSTNSRQKYEFISFKSVVQVNDKDLTLLGVEKKGGSRLYQSYEDFSKFETQLSKVQPKYKLCPGGSCSNTMKGLINKFNTKRSCVTWNTNRFNWKSWDG